MYVGTPAGPSFRLALLPAGMVRPASLVPQAPQLLSPWPSCASARIAGLSQPARNLQCMSDMLAGAMLHVGPPQSWEKHSSRAQTLHLPSP